MKYLLCLYRIVVCLPPVSTRRTATINAQVSDVRDLRGSMVRGGGGGLTDLKFFFARKSGPALCTKYVKLLREVPCLVNDFR